MNPWAWYEFYMLLQQSAYQNFKWIPPYHIKDKNRNHEVFKMGDPENDSDVYVPGICSILKSSWLLWDGLRTKDLF